MKQTGTRIVSMILAILLTAGACFPALADDKLNILTINGNILTGEDGTKYYYNVTGGAHVYIPYDVNGDYFDSKKLGQAFLKKMGVTTNYGASGSLASTAAFRYSGYEGIKSGAQYYAKYAAINTYGGAGSDDWGKPSYSDGDNGYVSFRYAVRLNYLQRQNARD